ncbi:Ig-like V-type domain-containing protein FAM187A [Salvelinus sp. IW2-2015]|uniref:Ig-like V-type domain-containing protein FAM187A n=1 Tax=Salvelinus sp. IW2-2015 TaxID=2691554 RepID=UPI000CEB0490|nr:Ig-like V-type domain-containing protein FAM187A [Salvelinus alpinus]
MMNPLKHMSLLLLLLQTLSFSLLSTYEAPEDKEDIFASRACPAFLVFDNAAYLVDMTIELPCHCKPEEAHSVVWYYQKKLGSPDTRALTDFQGTSVVDSSKVGRGGDLRSRFSIRLFSLLIFRAQKEDSGHYLCGTTKGDFFYGYDVDVQEAHRVSFPWSRAQRRGRAAAMAARAASRSNQDLPLYQVFTSFWPWSVCDRCGVRGEQTRVGLCYVKSDYLHVRYRWTSQTVASCGSSAVPQRFGLTQTNHQGAELGVRSCQVPCPPKSIPQPEQQALLEFLGYNDQAAQGVPVYYHNHPVDTPLILSCPGAKPQHAVAWDQGSRPLYRSQYMEGLNVTFRLFIDTGHHLHFSPATQDDRGSYYCWIQGKRAAEIRLGVYYRLGHKRLLSDPESLYALRIILLCYGGMTGVFVLIVLLKYTWRTVRPKVAKY